MGGWWDAVIEEEPKRLPGQLGNEKDQGCDQKDQSCDRILGLLHVSFRNIIGASVGCRGARSL